MSVLRRIELLESTARARRLGADEGPRIDPTLLSTDEARELNTFEHGPDLTELSVPQLWRLRELVIKATPAEQQQ